MTVYEIDACPRQVFYLERNWHQKSGFCYGESNQIVPSNQISYFSFCFVELSFVQWICISIKMNFVLADWNFPLFSFDVFLLYSFYFCSVFPCFLSQFINLQNETSVAKLKFSIFLVSWLANNIIFIRNY